MNNIDSYVSIIDELKRVYWNGRTHTPFLLPIEMKICAQSIGLELVSVKPMKSPNYKINYNYG